MALQFATGSFAASLVLGDQVVDTGSGFVGKLLILFWSDQVTDGFSAAYSGGIGVALSSTSRRTMAWNGEDNVATVACSMNFLDTAVCQPRIGQGTDGIADFVSFGTGADAGKFTINWSNTLAAAALIKYIFIGGTDISQAFLGTFTGPAAGVTGNKPFTGVGFKGDYLLLLCSHQTVTGASISDVDVGIGMARSSTERWCSTWADDNGTTMAGRAESVVDDTKCLIDYNPNAGPGPTRDNIADFVSFDTDGFTLNYTQVTNGSHLFFALVLQGSYQMSLKQQARPTATGNQDIVTGFEPEGLMLVGSFATLNATETNQLHAIIGAGEATGTVTENSVWTSSASTINTDDNMRTLSTKIYNQNTNPATEAAAANLTAKLANGYRLNWSAVDVNARLFQHWAIGSSPLKSLIAVYPQALPRAYRW